jgi:hypothetical protein
MSSVTNEGGSTREWRNLRREIIARDNGKCKLCGARGSVVDHIKPRSSGGSDDKSNLRLLCITCDKKKRAREAAARAKKSLDAGLLEIAEKVNEITKSLDTSPETMVSELEDIRSSVDILRATLEEVLSRIEGVK